MNTKIKITIFNEDFIFTLRKLDRAKLYGFRRIVPKCGGEVCQKAYIDETGVFEITNGCSKFFDDESIPGLAALDKTARYGKPRPSQSNNVLDGGEAFFIDEETYAIDYSDFLDCEVSDVYKLEAGDEKSGKKAAALLGEKIYEIWRSSKGDWHVFVKEGSLFLCILLSCNPTVSTEGEPTRMDDDNGEAFEIADIDFEDLW